MGLSEVRRMKELEKEDGRLYKAVSVLTLEKLTLKDNFDHLKPKAPDSIKAA